MKKTILSIFLSFLAITALGQNYGFSIDDENEPYLSGTISYDCQPTTAWNRLVTCVNNTYSSIDHKLMICNLSQKAIIIDNDTHTISVHGFGENSKIRFNPFAGTFGDYILYSLTLTMKEDGEITYLYNNLALRYKATGLVNENQTKSVRLILKELKQANEKAADTNLSKKERNSILNSVKDMESTLSKAVETLMKRLEAIIKDVE